jgi:hypothetical protein
MSGSPKYNTVSSSEQRRRQAEQARRERERQRREQERQRQAAALEEARRQALRRATELAERVTALRREGAAAGLAGVGATAGTRLAEAQDAVRRAGTPKKMAAAALAVEQCERTLVTARHEIEAHRRQVAGERVAAVARQLAEVPAEVRTRWDPVGADEAEQLLTVARRYADKAPAESDPRAAAAADAVREHLDRVLGLRAEHESRVAAADRAVAEVRARLATLRADAEQTRVPLLDGPEAEQRLAALTEAVRAGDADRVLAGLPELGRVLDRAEARLDAHIDRVVERRELLNSIIRALPEAGFAVDRESYQQRADGAMELRADSPAGQQFAVLLRDGGTGGTEVLYTTDTMAGAVVAGPAAGGACGSLLGVIEQLSAEARRDGFEPGTVHWDDDEDGSRPPSGGYATRPGTRGRTA